DSTAEIVLDDLRVKAPQGIRRVLDTTYFQTKSGLFGWDKGLQKIADSRAYAVLSADMKGAFYNPEYNEFWFLFDSNSVLVSQGKGIRQYRYDIAGADVRAGLYGFGENLLGIGHKLCKTDLDSGADDLGTPITASAQSNSLGNLKRQMKILEVQVVGQDMKGQVDLDLQRKRLERNGPGGWSTEFSPDVSK